MATKLYDSIIFGPIQSRRLGVSLGVNLLALNKKICSFDCVYCECGFTQNDVQGRFAEKKVVIENLESVLKEMLQNEKHLDVITFAGNGEPTLHPNFDEIIDATILLRNHYFPKAKISVLSNATTLNKESVIKALSKVDNNILKLDSGLVETIKLIDQPTSSNFSIDTVINGMLRFNGDFIMQTMFLKGDFNGMRIDNTTENEVNAWLEIVKITHPKQIMIYSIDRDTPVKTLEKVSKQELSEIAKKAEELGFFVSVAG
ncbi:MAG: radical SAM protein [Paludibacteraceae bacterium]|nr:radical SAM protein [Paludibacteraceae bacterium]MBQ9099811.1 radical SAM protein [Paludibacteraceae bacterium]